jgi:hypothetical protein
MNPDVVLRVRWLPRIGAAASQAHNHGQLLSVLFSLRLQSREPLDLRGSRERRQFIIVHRESLTSAARPIKSIHAERITATMLFQLLLTGGIYSDLLSSWLSVHRMSIFYDNEYK